MFVLASDGMPIRPETGPPETRVAIAAVSARVVPALDHLGLALVAEDAE
jgi:hypothetical protein